MSLPIQHHRPRRAEDLQPLAGDLTLRRGRVHEFCGPSRLMLAARIMAGTQGPVIWIRPGWLPERLNAAGLQPLADPARLILVQTDRDENLLWATEEALRSGAAPLVVAELSSPPALTPIRRLHLAAEAGAEAARRDAALAPPAPSRTLLWSDEDRWCLARLRARLAPPATWLLSATPRGEVTLIPNEVAGA
ncbi:MAG: hypothetical protein FD150_1776 [Rhodobacteraceae bacterium]|nr:MAG: hypothetical protein FD150_1776 [Paracoccaceae bacterium]